MLEPTIATLGIGLLIGYIGQRSRMCFVGGFRDFLLVRDTELLRGLLAFFVTAWLAFSLAGFFGLLQAPASGVTAAPPSGRQILASRSWPLPGHEISIASAASLTFRGHWNSGTTAGGPASYTSPRATGRTRASFGVALSKVESSTGVRHAAASNSVIDRIGSWLRSLPYSGSYLALTLFAAFALGLLSVLANGCPFRQHVLAAQGVSGAVYYLAGFYGGILIYDRFLVHWLFRML